MKELGIGDNLYKFVDIKGVFEYVVTEIRECKENTFYVAECQQCSHAGGKCLILLVKDDSADYFKFVRMANNNGEYYWHISYRKTDSFHRTKEECKLYANEEILNKYKEKLRKSEEETERLKNKITEIEFLIGQIKETTGGKG